MKNLLLLIKFNLKCIPLCGSRAFWLKDFGHWSHLNGLSPVWVRVCVTTCDRCLKRLPQILHSWFFSFKWTCLLWAVIDLFREKLLLHSLHVYYLTPLCSSMCRLNWHFTKNVLSQSRHWKEVPLLCFASWSFNQCSRVKACSHWLHE